MKGFKRCPNGHYYNESLTKCPYCPATVTEKTAADNATSAEGAEFEKTRVVNPVSEVSASTVVANSAANNRTQIVNSDVSRTMINNMESKPSGNIFENSSFGKTRIIDPDSSEEPTPDGKPAQARSTRKLVGWLVSYTIDEMGIDFKLYEGRNTIGTKPDNTITIINDSSISSHHVTILYRTGKYKIKDEMSSNGSYLNGVEMEAGDVYDLSDNDNIKLGNTEFKFKTSF